MCTTCGQNGFDFSQNIIAGEYPSVEVCGFIEDDVLNFEKMLEEHPNLFNDVTKNSMQGVIITIKRFPSMLCNFIEVLTKLKKEYEILYNQNG